MGKTGAAALYEVHASISGQDLISQRPFSEAAQVALRWNSRSVAIAKDLYTEREDNDLSLTWRQEATRLSFTFVEPYEPDDTITLGRMAEITMEGTVSAVPRSRYLKARAGKLYKSGKDPVDIQFSCSDTFGISQFTRKLTMEDHRIQAGSDVKPHLLMRIANT